MKTPVLALLLMFGFLTKSQTTVKQVNAQEFKTLIESKKGILIDLRTNDELLKKGMIKGAKQIDYFAKDAEKIISALDKTKTYFIYCAGGGRSGECADLMKQLGFKEVYNLEKGFDDWKRKGFEVVTK